MPSESEPSGVLLVDKPVGPTSFEVVKRVRRALRVKSAGHTGTLDPNASGLLPVCVGDATRIATFVTEGEKVYEGLVRFGVTTDTLDLLGKVLQTRDASHLRQAEIALAIESIVGTQGQAAPMYSARKVDGRRLYELAREGKEVEREEREITVAEARLLGWASPDARILFRCSKGTYIRVLAADLGERLQVGAHLAGLRRTASGALNVLEALPLERIEARGVDSRAELRSVERVLSDMPSLKLDERLAASVAFGNSIEGPQLERLGLASPVAGQKVTLLGPDELIVAIGEGVDSGGVRLVRVLRARVGPGTYRRGAAASE
jgi:tRNA pseudouridine55 synthase